MAYDFTKLANGNVDVLEGGKSIYGANTPGVSSAYAKTLGYKDPTSGVPAEDLAAFSKANPGLTFNAEDRTHYDAATTPDVTTPQPIVYSADALSNPSTLFKNPNPPLTPNYSAMISSVPTIESIAGAKSADQLKAETDKGSLETQVLDVLKGIGTKSAFTATQEQNAGVPDLEKNLNDVNAQISVLQNEAKAIPLQIQNDSTGRGRTDAGVAPLEADALRTNAIKALTLSSIAETYRGNLATATAQVERAVAAEFDPKQAELDYLKAALQINAGHMSDADREQATVISAKLQERQDVLDKQKSDKETTLKTVLVAAQNHAPAALLSTASTQDPITAAVTLQKYLQQKEDFTLSAGQKRYDAEGNLIAAGAPVAATGITSYDENGNPIYGPVNTLSAQPAYSKLNPTQKGKADALNNLVTQLNKYRSLINSSVGESGILLTGVDAAQLESSLNSIMFAAAQAEGTGALQAADRAVIEKIIPNPTQFSSAAGTLLTGGKAGQLAKIDGQIDKYVSNMQGYGLSPTSTGQVAPAQDIGDAFDTVVLGGGPTIAASKAKVQLPGDSLLRSFFSGWF